MTAKALVFEVEGVKAGLVTCDLSSMPAAIVEKARAEIERRTGIAGERVMISATHTHTGPVLLSGRDIPSGPELDVARRYLDELPGRIADSVWRAASAMVPARLSAGLGREETISFNRRFFMADGTVGWNPGKLNPKIVRPAGPIDPDVAVLYLETVGGRPLATYVNFALHLDTVGGQQFSADYPYTLANLLARVKSPDMLTLFTIGAAGNVNHIDVRSATPQKGHAEAARIGTVLAGEVIKTYARLNPITPAAPAVGREIVKLPADTIPPGEVEKAREIAAKYGKPGAAPFLEFVRAFKVIDIAGREGKPIEAEVQVIAFGKELALVGLPGEIFVELGQAIKKASPFRQTVIVELANGSIGYVPDRKAYAEGAYEVVSTRCAPGSGEMLVEAALRLLRASP